MIEHNIPLVRKVESHRLLYSQHYIHFLHVWRKILIFHGIEAFDSLKDYLTNISRLFSPGDDKMGLNYNSDLLFNIGNLIFVISDQKF